MAGDEGRRTFCGRGWGGQNGRRSGGPVGLRQGDAVRLWERGGRAWQGCVVARGARGATCFVRAGAHVVCGTGLKPQCGSAAA